MLNLLCLVSDHKVDRRHVWYDSLNYRGHCKRCGKPLIKEMSIWKEFDSDRHANASRKPHPKSDR